jgi:anti-anti-sigma factor
MKARAAFRLKQPMARGFPSAHFTKGTMHNISINITDDPHNKEITHLAVEGFIDTLTAPEFEKEFLWLLKNKKFKLVVDLKKVDYISSAGWGIFVSELKRIRGKKGDLVLAGMSPDVAEVFDLLEFNVILKSFPDVESAVQKGFE